MPAHRRRLPLARAALAAAATLLLLPAAATAEPRSHRLRFAVELELTRTYPVTVTPTVPWAQCGPDSWMASRGTTTQVERIRPASPLTLLFTYTDLRSGAPIVHGPVLRSRVRAGNLLPAIASVTERSAAVEAFECVGAGTPRVEPVAFTCLGTARERPRHDGVQLTRVRGGHRVVVPFVSGCDGSRQAYWPNCPVDPVVSVEFAELRRVRGTLVRRLSARRECVAESSGFVARAAATLTGTLKLRRLRG